MQEHPVRITVIGIRHVAQDWISRVFQVQTNLVTSSRDWFTPNSRHLDALLTPSACSTALHDFEARLARFAVFFVHALAKTFWIVVVLAYGGDGPLVVFGPSKDDGEIRLFALRSRNNFAASPAAFFVLAVSTTRSSPCPIDDKNDGVCLERSCSTNPRSSRRLPIAA